MILFYHRIMMYFAENTVYTAIHGVGTLSNVLLLKSHANDMAPPAMSFPTWDRTGQHSPMPEEVGHVIELLSNAHS